MSATHRKKEGKKERKKERKEGMEEESKTERTKGINLRNKTQVQFLVQPKSNVPWTEKRAQHIYVHLFEMCESYSL